MLQNHIIPINTMEAVNTMEDTTIIAAKEDAVSNEEEIGEMAKVSKATVI